jgi:hypothetical protein
MPTIPHPATDTPRGVVARRGRRFWRGTDVGRRPRGLRKMVSLRRHGGSGGRRTEPSASCPERRAGRACAAHKGAGLADASASSAGMRPSGRQNLPSTIAMARDGRMTKRKRPPSGNRRTPSIVPAFAERPELRAKTAERGAERRHTHTFRCGTFQRPVRCSLKKPRAENRRVDVGAKQRPRRRIHQASHGL